MGSPTPTIASQAQWIRDCLSNWARTEGGVAVVAHDLSSMWAIAFRQSKVPRCIITFAGEDIRGDFEIAAETSRVDRHFIVLVTRARGMTATRGDTLTEDVGEARPFYDLLEEARDIIRSLQFDPTTTEAYGLNPVDYKGIKPALPEDYPMDAYAIEFSIGTQLGIPVLPAPTPLSPSAPFHLAVVSGSASLTWDVDSFDATETSVWRSTNGTTYTNYATASGAMTLAYIDTGVTGGNSYWYKVARYNSVGTSSFSNTASISFP